MSYRFGDFEIEPLRHELRKSGIPIAIEPQAFALLLYLVEHRDRLVSKEDLNREIWEGRVVSEWAMSTAIKRARQAIGDSGIKQDFIRTIPRRGYRFIGEVEVRRDDHAIPEPTSASVEAKPGEHIQPEKPSIAVLPFKNLSNDPEQEYLADGIAEDLITSLSQIHELFVVARMSSFYYKGRSQDLRLLAKQLNVRYLLEGSLRRAGDRIRISVQLIDGRDGSNVWAARYDRETVDLFELQDQIMSEIATALQVRLTEGQQAYNRRNQTVSIPAWELYQQALFHWRRLNQGDNVMARDLLENALHHDEQFVSALSLLAWTYVVEARLPWGPSRNEAIDKGMAAIYRAMEVTDDNPDVLSILGNLKLAVREYDEAERVQRRSVMLAPNSADIHVALAHTLNMRGKPNEAVGLIETAMRLCPFFPDWYLGILAVSYRLLKRYDEAINSDLRRLQINPANGFSDVRLSAVYAETGQMELARQHVEEALRKQPNYRLSHLAETDRYEDPKLMRQYEGLLRKAGLPA